LWVTGAHEDASVLGATGQLDAEAVDSELLGDRLTELTV
jgi:hypothetical protein